MGCGRNPKGRKKMKLAGTWQFWLIWSHLFVGYMKKARIMRCPGSHLGSSHNYAYHSGACQLSLMSHGGLKAGMQGRWQAMRSLHFCNARISLSTILNWISLQEKGCDIGLKGFMISLLATNSPGNLYSRRESGLQYCILLLSVIAASNFLSSKYMWGHVLQIPSVEC